MVCNFDEDKMIGWWNMSIYKETVYDLEIDIVLCVYCFYF